MERACQPLDRLETRFWSKACFGDGCWEWGAGVDAKGYGRFHAVLAGRRVGLAHRVAWELTHGPIPAGLCVLHKCDNPPCVRPGHLFLGTVADNNADMRRKGRHATGEAVARLVRGERQGGHRLTERDVLEIRSLAALGMSRRELAGVFGVSKSTVHAAVSGQNWAWLT